MGVHLNYWLVGVIMRIKYKKMPYYYFKMSVHLNYWNKINFNLKKYIALQNTDYRTDMDSMFVPASSTWLQHLFPPFVYNRSTR